MEDAETVAGAEITWFYGKEYVHEMMHHHIEGPGTAVTLKRKRLDLSQQRKRI